MVELTCSIAKGRGSLRHNNRSFAASSVDATLSRNNFVLVDQTLEETYHQLFDQAVAAYNAKQTRDDRKISNYLDKIQRSKQEKPFYEIVVEVGSTADIAKGSPEEDLCRKALDEYAAAFQQRNPAFKVFQAIRHEDEPAGLCHYHIDFVPISTGNKRGLETKNSLSGAFAAMGFGRNGFSEWREQEQKELIRCMQQQGIEYKPGTGRSVHLTAAEMRNVKQQIDELPSISPKKVLFGVKRDQIDLTIDQGEKLLSVAKNGILVDAASKKREKQLDAKEKQMKNREVLLDSRERKLDQREAVLSHREDKLLMERINLAQKEERIDSRIDSQKKASMYDAVIDCIAEYCDAHEGAKRVVNKVLDWVDENLDYSSKIKKTFVTDVRNAMMDLRIEREEELRKLSTYYGYGLKWNDDQNHDDGYDGRSM